MKKCLPVLFILFTCSALHAQYNCEGNRFLEEVFDNVVKSEDQNYGQAVNTTGANQNLLLDVYEPSGDTMQARPLIIWAHGGSFIFGNKESGDIVTLCNKYSKMGYVTASINYRLGFEGFLPSANTATETVFRATTDMRAAIRYFYKDALTSNQFKIDTNNIFVGGVSAGAFIALHLAYLDEESELPEAINPDEFGGIEGNSGNPGYSSKVKAIINLCGALGDTSWIETNDIPCLSMHGTNDDVVPYGTDVINVLSIPLFEVDGSASVARRQSNTGTENIFVTWPDAIHTPFIGTDAYMDSVFMAVTPFLANKLGCDVALAVNEIEPEDQIMIYPNPANTEAWIETHGNTVNFRLLDASGRLVFQGLTSGRVDLSFYEKGIYLIQIQEKNTIKTGRLIIS